MNFSRSFFKDLGNGNLETTRGAMSTRSLRHCGFFIDTVDEISVNFNEIYLRTSKEGIFFCEDTGTFLVVKPS